MDLTLMVPASEVWSQVQGESVVERARLQRERKMPWRGYYDQPATGAPRKGREPWRKVRSET